MISNNIILTLTDGLHKEDSRYELEDGSVYVIGRGADCYPRVSNDLLHVDVSRHHCLLSVDLPDVWIQDLGSTNGTYVNGEKLSLREEHERRDERWEVACSPRRLLSDGDEIRLGSYAYLHLEIDAKEVSDSLGQHVGSR